MTDSKLYNMSSFFKVKNDTLINNRSKKHFPAAINEWKISSYNFNKASQRNIASRDSMTDSLIKSYFYFSDLKIRPRSKRMRSLYRKYTSKKIFVSSPTIKQTNDKVIVSLFTYNREKLFLLKKLYYYNRRLTFIDIWRKTKAAHKLTNYNSLNKKKPINLITNNIIKQNKNIYTQFISKLTDRNEKIKLYKKISSKIFTNLSKYKYSNMITKKEKKIYNKKRLVRFRYKEDMLATKNFIRKKMNRFDSSSMNEKKKSMHKQKIPNWGIELKNEMNFLSFKILSVNKNLAYIRKLFYFYFLKYIFSIFHLKIVIYKTSGITNKNFITDVMYENEMSSIKKESNMKTRRKRNKKSKFISKTSENLASLYNSPRTIKSKGSILKLCFFKVKKDATKIRKILKVKTNNSTSEVFSFFEPVIINVNVEKTENIDSTLSNINFIITQFLDKILTMSKLADKERKLYILYNIYYKKYYDKYLDSLIKKQDLLSVYYTRFMINKFKFSNWLPNLKLSIGKLYNKKVELNIINLKYPHLNTDIYSKLISLKLRKRLSLLKVIAKGLGLSKRPTVFKDKTQIKVDYDLNKLSSLNKYKTLNFENTNLTELMHKIYPRSMVNNANSISKSIDHVIKLKVIKSKIKNVLMLIKYKAVSGVRIEAAGRVTRRYTASRSVHKIKYKGNLRNIDYSRSVELKNKSQSAVMLRNQTRANMQYSATQSKRRVGSFGIKGWISGY